jgi:hypothetical protein
VTEQFPQQPYGQQYPQQPYGQQYPQQPYRDQTRPFAPQPQWQPPAGGGSHAAPKPPKDPNRKWHQKKRYRIPLALLVVGAIGSALDDDQATPQPQADLSISESPFSEAPEPEPSPEPEAKTQPAPKTTQQAPKTTQQAPKTQPAPEPEEEETAGSGSGSGVSTSKQNALEAAESYLSWTNFSRQGLIDQLSSEYGNGFSVADATWAVDQLDEDWSAQAVGAAESYLDLTSFSCSGLIEQLSSEYGSQFTDAQARHAATAVGLC